VIRRLGGLAALAGLALALLAQAAGAAVVEKDRVVRSFDGTRIVYTLMLPDSASAASPVPAVMMTHGWGGTGQDTPDGFAGKLLDHGYAVLTWDQRGFGDSGGQAEIDDPRYEGRDAKRLVGVLAADPRIAKEAPGDPLVGMVGGSYAGGIQWVTAAQDPRVDAIVPQISWHNLLQSLIPQGVVKLQWDLLLYGDGAATTATGGVLPPNPGGTQTGSYDPMIHRAFVQGTTLGRFGPRVSAWFAAKGPDYLLRRVRVPTFIIQGTVDTLFPPSQGVANYRAMQALHPGQPLKMAFYCGGHGTCSFDPGPADYIDDETIAWLDRYVKGDASVATGPAFEYVTQDGVWHGASDYPVPGTVRRTASGSGLVAVNGAPTTSGGLPGAAPSPAALGVPLPSAPGTLIGAPHVTLTERSAGAAEDGLSRLNLFLQVVDETDGVVVGNQVTPVALRADGRDHTYSLSLEPIAYTIEPGHRLALQIASTAAGYEANRGAGVVNLKRVSVSVPALP